MTEAMAFYRRARGALEHACCLTVYAEGLAAGDDFLPVVLEQACGHFVEASYWRLLARDARRNGRPS